MHPLIFPDTIRPGETIAIVSPAGPSKPSQEHPTPLESGQQLLEQLGYRVKLMPNATKQGMYLAGSDAERLSDLHAAFADPDVDAVLCARGGYGCTRLLEQIDYDLIRNNPKPLIGFSDITSLLIAVYQQTGLVGFYGPMLTSNLIHQEPFSQQQLFHLVSGDYTLPLALPNQNAYQCFRPGITEGRLIGGNLSLLTSLCGTPFQPKTQGHILFIEDWHEKYYTLDRQFQQLKMAGLFNDIKGLLLCDFSEIETEPEMSLPDFLQHLVADLPVPVGYGFSVGHGKETGTLPVGCMARFDATNGALLLLEKPVAQR